jgi:hypothetical protein
MINPIKLQLQFRQLQLEEQQAPDTWGELLEVLDKALNPSQLISPPRRGIAFWDEAS